jgi:hypothetical protein
MTGLFAQEEMPQVENDKARAEIGKALAKVELEIERDKFKGSALVGIKGDPSNIPGQSVYSRTIYVSPSYFLSSGGTGSFALTVLAIFEDWAFLDGSIDMLIDGQQEHISSSIRTDTEILGLHQLREAFTVMIPEELIVRMSKASMIEVRINGKRQDVTGNLRPEHIAQFIKIQEAPRLLGKIDQP